MVNLQNHLDERALALFLDNELDDQERAAFQLHLDACSECHTAIEHLRSGAGALSAILERVDVDIPTLAMPRRSRPTAHWRPLRYFAAAAAAGILVLLAISPARAWVTERLFEFGNRLFGAEEPVDQVSGTGSDAQPMDTPNMIGVSIPVTGDVLRIRLTNRQQRGTLTVSIGDTPTPSAEIEGGGGERLVLSDGLMIANEPTSTASYRVRVPSNLTVELFILEEPVRRFVFGGAVNSWEVDLRPN